MSANSSDLMWAFVEEAVIRDRGCNEEQCLNDIVRSYLWRRGMADTLEAFNSELRECEALASPDGPSRGEEGSPTAAAAAAPREDEYGGILIDVKGRKHAQLLCLSGNYEEAAAMMPATSYLRVKLLSLEALRQANQLAGISYASTKIAPLVPCCDDTMAAHRIYLETVACLLDGRSEEVFAARLRDIASTANEVNEELLAVKLPSALNVLMSWGDWQQRSLSHDC